MKPLFKLMTNVDTLPKHSQSAEHMTHGSLVILTEDHKKQKVDENVCTTFRKSTGTAVVGLLSCSCGTCMYIIPSISCIDF